MTRTNTLELSTLKDILSNYEIERNDSLIPVLLDVQREYGYISEPMVSVISNWLKVSEAEIFGVIEFYTMLYSEPVGNTLIRVCVSPMCEQKGGSDILAALCDRYNVQPGETTPDGAFTIEAVECLGLCDHSPAGMVNETQVGELTKQEQNWENNPRFLTQANVGGTTRWLTSRIGRIDPVNLSEYEAQEGFSGFKKALSSMSREQIIEDITRSKLSGRGGAAFPTGLKLKFTSEADGNTKYVVCNGDESEPGTFKDRVLMEGDPFSIVEGMLISGYAVGANMGFIYIRGEYPKAQSIIQSAIDNAYSAGYLGQNILGSGFNFDIKLRSGAGAYICGEETALFESIEGKRGYPRLKPPFPTTNGLFGKSTAINNVETLASISWIMTNGVDKYLSIGTEASPGTKLFCLSGDVVQPGVYEAPFGITINEVIEMAGGAIGGIQAVLLGGAAGSYVFPDNLDLHLCIHSLWDAGFSLGSGVINVINTDADLREHMLSLAHFFAHESCGKCFPCQLGTQRQLEILHKVAIGEALPHDIQALEDIGFAMTHASFCGLGMTASTAILSALDHSRNLFISD